MIKISKKQKIKRQNLVIKEYRTIWNDNKELMLYLSATHKIPFPYSTSPMKALVFDVCNFIPSVGNVISLIKTSSWITILKVYLK